MTYYIKFWKRKQDQVILSSQLNTVDTRVAEQLFSDAIKDNIEFDRITLTRTDPEIIGNEINMRVWNKELKPSIRLPYVD